MVMIAEEKMQKINETLTYFMERVNECRANKAYNMANDWLDMLLGALSIYNEIASVQLTLKEHRNGELEFEAVQKG